MRFVIVKFINYDKPYVYRTNLPLQIGGVYNIVADDKTKYNTPVKVEKYTNKAPTNINVRTITDAKCLIAAPIPIDRIERVIFNEKKKSTTILWDDGMKTTVRASNGDEYNKEAGIALCYMKRVLGNRGSFNNTLKKWVPEAYESAPSVEVKCDIKEEV